MSMSEHNKALFDVNLTAYNDQNKRIVHVESGKEIPRIFFQMAWSAGTRVFRALEIEDMYELHDCYCDRCENKEGKIRNLCASLIANGFPLDPTKYIVETVSEG